MPRIPTDKAVQYLIASGANAALAAVNLQRDLGDEEIITASDILAAISADPQTPAVVGGQLRTFMLLSTFEALRKTHMVYIDKIADMTPAQIGKAYSDLLRAIEPLARGPAEPPNVADAIVRFLPPEMKEALAALMAADGSATIDAPAASPTTAPDEAADPYAPAANDPLPFRRVSGQP